MVGKTIKICGGLLTLLLILGISGLIWLLSTGSGAEWLLARLNSLDRVELESEVEGSVWAGLELTDLRVSWPGGKLNSDRFSFSWTPIKLLRRELFVDRLVVGSVRVFRTGVPSPSPEPPGDFHWPELPGWMLATIFSINDVSVSELMLEQQTEEPLILKDLRGSFLLRDGLLLGNQLSFRYPGGTASGAVSLDLRQKRIDADLIWSGPALVADYDRMQAKLTLMHDLTGNLQVTALSGMTEKLILQSKTVLTTSSLHLREMQVSRSQKPDRLSGTLSLEWGKSPRLIADLHMVHLDLGAEVGSPTDLTGTLQGELNSRGYAGQLDLESGRPGLERGHLATVFDGNWQGVALTGIKAAWLDGDVNGDLQLDWREGFRLSGNLLGTAINPERLYPEVTGHLQLTVNGDLHWSPMGQLSASWDAQLGQSELQGYPIQGHVAGHWELGDLIFDALDLQGSGLHVKGQGRLSRRIDLKLRVDDLARLGKTWQGELDGEGWLARSDGHWLGAGSGRLHNLRLGMLEAEHGHLMINNPSANTDGQLNVSLEQLSLDDRTLDQAELTVNGRIENHDINLQLLWPGGTLSGAANGDWNDPQWAGQLLSLSGREDEIGSWRLLSPTALVISAEQVVLSELRLLGDQGGRLQLKAEVQPQTWAGVLGIAWQDLPLNYLDPWLSGPALRGQASGMLQLETGTDRALTLEAKIQTTPTILLEGKELELSRSQAVLKWDQNGLTASGVINFSRGGRVDVVLDSPTPGQLKQPDEGSISVDWESLDLQQLAPWMKDTTTLNGNWNGKVEGFWKNNDPLSLAGRTWIDHGELKWQGQDGLIRVPLQQAELNGNWQSGRIIGELHLGLSEQGRIDGWFNLPTTRNLPDAPLKAEIDFDMDVLGSLMMLLPEVTNANLGNLKGQLSLAGNLSSPKFGGHLLLRDGEAEVPILGLKLREIGLDTSFEDSTLKLNHLQLSSGDGRLDGSGSLQLSGWQPESWLFSLKGDNFRVVHLPEVTIEVTPDLQLSGTTDLLSVQGKVLVPTLLVNQIPRARMVEKSEDVVVGDVATVQPPRRFDKLDVNLNVLLGEHVVVKAKGLDARLEGEVSLITDSRSALGASGEIRVAQGHYAAYGLKLPITRGRASFSGGSPQNPLLDVLAERTIGEVKAGVQVTGTPRKPRVKLVSDPSMPDTEILSYIVLGRPLGTQGGQSDSLILAANALLSQGESAAMQEKLKRRFGIDVLEVRSGSGDTLEGSMVEVGKYLTPDLYLSYGQSLFSPENFATLRYQLDQHWEIESQLGTISGADIAYRLEFR